MKTSSQKLLAGATRPCCARRAIWVLALLLVQGVQAQVFTYIVTNGTVTITRYTGPGGNVTIPETIDGLPVTAIGRQAFLLSAATSVTLPNSVTTIAAEAFSSSRALASVALPNTLADIGDKAFYQCISLPQVAIPASVTNIGTVAFFECTSLQALTVEAANASYSSLDGVLFDKDRKNLIQFPPGRPGTYTLPSGVTNIGYCAFYGNTNLTSVTAPEGLISIADDAFGGCSALTRVTMPGSLISIGAMAFWACNSLSDAAIPNAVTTIGVAAFEWCSSLTSINVPASVTQLEDVVFQGCTSVTNVTIQNAVLGYGEFAGCKGLAAISIPNAITNITDSAFGGTGLTSVTIPDSVTRIGDGAFGGCSSLTNIDIPNSVTYIGGDAFRWCTALGSIRIPDSVTLIGDGHLNPNLYVTGTFSECVNLTNVVLGNGLKYIGGGAFFRCESLGTITIPASVQRLGDFAFAFCTNLAGAYFKGNAPSINEGSRIFVVPGYSTNSTTVYYLPGTTGWGATFAERPTALWVLPYPVILTTSPGFGIQNGQFRFTISWATNSAVVVEASTSMAEPQWVAVSTNTLNAGWCQFTAPQGGNEPARFFRVRSP